MAYDQFASPIPSAAFSESFFSSMTFEHASNLTYPTISPPKMVLHWSFSLEVHLSGAATVISPLESVLHIEDIQQILRDMEEAFGRGMRSVKVCCRSGHGETTHHYHFCKIRLFKLINNHVGHVEFAWKTLHHISHPGFHLGLDIIEWVKKERICSSIKGFHNSGFQLYKLGNLLSENWLEEDVLNSLFELRYLLHHAEFSSKPGVPPPFLYLPTNFFTNARQLYNNQPRVYSKELQDLRKRMTETVITHMAFSICEGNHYAAYLWKYGHIELEHGDSLHCPPSQDVIEILQWVFAGLEDKVTAMTSIKKGFISHQGVNGYGTGSCAIASLNFIEHRMNSDIPPWTSLTSREFRDHALRDLLIYHMCASTSVGNASIWLDNCITPSSYSLNSGFVGYPDFNMFSPKDIHPVYNFLLTSKKLPRLLPPPKSLMPFIGQLECEVILNRTLPIQVRSKPEPDLDVSKLLPSLNITPQRKRQRHGVPQTIRSPSLEIVSPSQSRPIKRQKSEPLLISFNVCNAKDAPKDMSPHSVIEIMSSDSDSEMVITKDEESHPSTNLLKQPPINWCAKSNRQPRTPSPSLNSKEVIDLVTPDSKPIVVEQKPTVPIPSGSSRVVVPAPGLIVVGSVYETLDEAVDAIFKQELALGHVWRRGQSYDDAHGRRKKLTLRCNHYQKPDPVHINFIDPADHRTTKSRRTNCDAHVNINRLQHSDCYHITTIVRDHNHPPEIPHGGLARRPATLKQKELVAELATSVGTRFNRSQIAAVLKNAGEKQEAPWHLLEPRQISNLINQSRSDARAAVNYLGGDFAAIIKSLEEKTLEDRGWRYRIKLDEKGVVTAIWWQSPLQLELTKRFGDILINDNSYNRNRTGYPLNIGVIIDNFGKSRNAWYALQQKEDADLHGWIFVNHLESADGIPPEVLASDRSRAVITSARRELPLTDHIYCIFHLDDNVTKNLRIGIGAEWPNFQRDFWATYRAVSPEEFDRLWKHLVSRYPSGRDYLEKELYPCRERWAWPWVSSKFTAGVRTNGRVEVENRMNKELGNAKATCKQLFDGLNLRTNGQSMSDMVRVRDSSRRQHPSNIETIFPGPLKLLRDHVGPFALQKCYTEMELSMFYQTEVLKRPAGIRDWTEYAITVDQELGFEWQGGEENKMICDFTNDDMHISTKWLLRLINGRGLHVKHLLQIRHRGKGTLHILAILEDDRFVCDCCMGTNLGIPCRHYFQALTVVKELEFQLGMVRPRWYQDNKLDPKTIPSTSCGYAMRETRYETSLVASSITAELISNPLQNSSQQGPPPTATVPARTVLHTAEAALRPLLNGVQTQEQLDALIRNLEQLQDTTRENEAREGIRDPPVHNPKGRPRTQRLTGPTEGRPRGGGARAGPVQKSLRRCSECHQSGHNRTTCPKQMS